MSASSPSDLHELPADLVGDSAFMDVVIYRVAEPHRSKLQAGTAFAAGDAAPGMEVFTVGYPLGWGPTMAFGRLGNTNTFLQTVETRLIQADLSACSGNSGGGLFNAQGDIVGIMHAIIQTEKEETQAHCSRMTFAIPGILAERIVNAALAGKPLAFSKMGIHMTSVKDGTKWRMAVKDVADPAKEAGIQKHDILLAIEDHGDSRCGPAEELSDRADNSRAACFSQGSTSRCRSDVHSHTGGRIESFRGSPTHRGI